MTVERLLEVEDLSTSFATFEGAVRAVEGVSFSLGKGETLALVGESGCGKSVTARSIMGLYSGRKVTQKGRVLFEGEDLAVLDQDSRSAFRGGRMAMIFQEPMSAFDPLATVEEQMVAARLAHAPAEAGQDRAKAAKALAVEALRGVGIPDPEIRIRDYPHKLSGGMLQRVLIAIALMNEPELLIADEPTTALDVTIQAQVLALIRELRERKGMSVLFITHDLGVVAEIADRVHVMYSGHIVEKATTPEFFGSVGEGPLHPYGQGLLASRIRGDIERGDLPSIPGYVPKPIEMPTGCAFAPRCGRAGPRCLREAPPLAPVGAREVACHLYQGGVE
jgi:oligopeptide/dipeptide ABC transporter ATP-binding protein